MLKDSPQIQWLVRPSATCGCWVNLPQSQDQMQSLWAFSLCKARENIPLQKDALGQMFVYERILRWNSGLGGSEIQNLEVAILWHLGQWLHIYPQRCNFDLATIYYLIITRLRSSRSRYKVGCHWHQTIIFFLFFLLKRSSSSSPPKRFSFFSHHFCSFSYHPWREHG